MLGGFIFMQKVAQFTFEIPIKRSKYQQQKKSRAPRENVLGGFISFSKILRKWMGVLFEEGVFIFKSLVVLIIEDSPK